MNKMNVIPLFISLFMLFSCNNKEQIASNLVERESVKNYQEGKNSYLSAQQVFYAATLEKIDQLEKEKSELIEKMESGEKDVIKDIEINQKVTGKYKLALDYFYNMRPPLGPLGPIGPMPPVGCFEEAANCEPEILSIKQIVIGKNKLEVTKFNIVDVKGVTVGTGKKGEGEFGHTILIKVDKFEGQANIHTVVTLEEIGDLTYEIPVRGY